MKIITISGLDGSGKSTQIQLLKNHLESQNKRVFYFHAIEFGLANRISRFMKKYCLICRLLGKCRTGTKPAKAVTEANFFQIIGRRLFLMADILRFKKLLKKLQRENFDYLLSDRYFYDSVVNIQYLSKSNEKLPCEKFILRPDLAIYLKTDPEIIMQRERKPEQGEIYLKEKKELYDNAVPVWNLKIFDGNRNQGEVFENIKEFL